MIHQRRAVRHFDEDILSDGFRRLRIFGHKVIERYRIVMEQILCHTGALRLPVKPQTAGAVMEMIPSDDHVDGRVHLDSADLRARQILTVVDMVDMVILDHGEYAAQMAHDTGLAAVMDIASADDMGADPLLRPAFPLCLTDAVTLCLRAVFEFPFQPLIVVLRLDRKSVV